MDENVNEGDYQRRLGIRTKRFNVSKLARNDDSGPLSSACFRNRWRTEQQQSGPLEAWNVEGKWKVITSALTKSAEVLLVTEDRCHTDWFR